MQEIAKIASEIALPIAVSLYAFLSVANCLIIRFGWERHIVKVDFVKHNALLSAYAPNPRVTTSDSSEIFKASGSISK